MKNKWLLISIVFSLVFWFGVYKFAFADPSFVDPALNVSPGATVVLPPAVPNDPIHMVLNAVIPGILALLTGLLAWASSNIQTWIKQNASKANTAESAAWYSTALNLAGIAVKYAETKFGPDTQRGKEKKDAAVAWLGDRIRSIDPTFFAKTPNAESFLSSLVDAAYHDVFVAVSPLAPSPASK